MFSPFLGIQLKVELLGEMVTLLFNFSRNYQTVFQGSCTIFILPSAAYECSNFSTSLQILVIKLLYSSHPAGCEVVSHSFNWHFLND